MTPPSPKKHGAQKIAVCPDDLRMTLPPTVKMKEKNKILSSISYIFQMVNRTSTLFLNHQHNQLKYTYFMKHLVE